jgi:Kdo2-lipid IVA lauroyltransferase/acyltransferase
VTQNAGMLLWMLRLLGLLPLWLLQAAGAAGGAAAFALSGAFRRKTVANLQVAGLYRPALAWASARAAGKAALETCYIWFRTDDVLLRKSQADSFVRLARATQAGKVAGERRGVIILTPHIGSFELGARAYGAVAPITVLYKAPRREALHHLLKVARSQPGVTPVPADTGGVRALLRALKRGEAIGILPDQVPSAGDGEWASFFGRPAFTMTLPARLAEKTGAPVYLLATWRRPWGRGWDLELRKVDRIPTPQVINQELEAVIRKRPDQYVWSYNRYKQPSSATGAAPAPKVESAPGAAADDV